MFFFLLQSDLFIFSCFQSVMLINAEFCGYFVFFPHQCYFQVNKRFSTFFPNSSTGIVFLENGIANYAKYRHVLTNTKRPTYGNFQCCETKNSRQQIVIPPLKQIISRYVKSLDPQKGFPGQSVVLVGKKCLLKHRDTPNLHSFLLPESFKYKKAH